MNFETLWARYPDYEPCNDVWDKPNFPNQCAIKMGVCLSNSGFPFDNYRGRYCWYHDKKMRHILRVEELVKYLTKKIPKDRLMIRKEKNDAVIDFYDFIGKQGIVAFINFWGKGNQGDHIDLFNKDRLKNGDIEYFYRSKKVMFWEIS